MGAKVGSYYRNQDIAAPSAENRSVQVTHFSLSVDTSGGRTYAPVSAVSTVEVTKGTACSSRTRIMRACCLLALNHDWFAPDEGLTNSDVVTVRPIQMKPKKVTRRVY